ncbi:MAG: hypothetical protein L0Y71_22665 [Gemmataceae bacterium]|nr:hypothetical protein [Gemmataceae bacterium]
MFPVIPPIEAPSTAEEDPRRRVQFRLWQISMSAITLLATLWCFTLHPIVGIIASFIAKHVLVAILAAGLTPVPASPPGSSNRG